MKIIYEAFDGETFDTEKECKEYESLHSYDSLEMMDEDYSPVTQFDDAYFVVIHNDLDKTRVENLLDAYGYDAMIKSIPTVLTWDNESENWKDIYVEIDDLNEKLTKLKEVLSTAMMKKYKRENIFNDC